MLAIDNAAKLQNEQDKKDREFNAFLFNVRKKRRKIRSDEQN